MYRQVIYDVMLCSNYSYDETRCMSKHEYDSTSGEIAWVFTNSQLLKEFENVAVSFIINFCIAIAKITKHRKVKKRRKDII